MISKLLGAATLAATTVSAKKTDNNVLTEFASKTVDNVFAYVGATKGFMPAYEEPV